MSDGTLAGKSDRGSLEEVTYHGYLELGTILDAQHPLAPPELGAQVNAAEHFFIVVHQANACWNLSRSATAPPVAPA
jgi:hypothetical protein